MNENFKTVAKQDVSKFEITILVSPFLGNIYKINNIKVHKDIYIWIFTEVPFIKAKIENNILNALSSVIK